MEMEQLVKLLIAVVVLIILIGAVYFLLVGKGGAILEGIKNILRLGK